MRNIVFIDASPKINEESASKNLIEMAGRMIDDVDTCKTFINIRQSMAKHKTQENYETLSKADAVLIAFPLYIFCMPGILTRFLQDYYQFILERGGVSINTRIYAIVNCGFPEPEINLEAVRVIRSFCQHINAQFRFGVLIWGGGMNLKKTLISLNKAFITIAKDIQSSDFNKVDNISIKINFPGWLYQFLINIGWGFLARRNGLKKRELYKKPYQ